MLSRLRLIASAFILSASASALSAAPIVFDLTGNGGLQFSHGFSESGIDLTVTAGAFAGAWNGADSTHLDDRGNAIEGATTSGNAFDSTVRVGQYAVGIGATNNTRACFGGAYVCSTDNSTLVDGQGWTDFLTLSFSEAVQLSAAEFGYFGANDGYRLFYDANGDGALGNDDFLTGRYMDARLEDVASISTTLLGFVASDATDGWTLSSVEVELLPNPLPAPILLLLAGLGGLYAIRRRA